MDNKITVAESEIENYMADQKEGRDGPSELLLSHILIRVPDQANPEQLQRQRARADEVVLAVLVPEAARAHAVLQHLVLGNTEAGLTDRPLGELLGAGGACGPGPNGPRATRPRRDPAQGSRGPVTREGAGPRLASRGRGAGAST